MPERHLHARASCCAAACSAALPGTTVGRRWAQDSRTIVYSRESTVYLHDIAGGPPRKLIDFSPDDVSDFDWTADGQSLLCVVTSYQRAAVVLKNVR